MKTTEVGKVTVSYKDGNIENINFGMNLKNNEYDKVQHTLLSYQSEIRKSLEVNQKEKLNEAAQFILSTVFSQITDLELRDFETSELESKIFCNEEDGVVTQCTIVYYLIEK